jgi:NitT/TauT family transport system substrate-binding protein
MASSKSKWTAIALAIIVALSSGASFGQTKRTKINLGVASSLIYMTAFVAQGGGFFEDEGLDADFVFLGSGPRLTAALVGGSADMIMLSLDNIVRSSAQGLQMSAVANLFGVYANVLALSNAAIERTGMTDAMTTDEKVRRLRGLHIAISNPGSGTDQFLRTLLLLRKLNPDTEIAIQPLGEGAAMVSAAEHGLVDGFVTNAPWPDLYVSRGLGRIVIDPASGQVPEYKDFPFIVLAALPADLEGKREQITHAIRALAKASKLIRDDPERARTITRGYFKGMEEPLFDLAFKKLSAGVPRRLTITEEQLATTVGTMNAASSQPVRADYHTIIATDISTGVDREIFGN